MSPCIQLMAYSCHSLTQLWDYWPLTISVKNLPWTDVSLHSADGIACHSLTPIWDHWPLTYHIREESPMNWCLLTFSWWHCVPLTNPNMRPLTSQHTSLFARQHHTWLVHLPQKESAAANHDQQFMGILGDEQLRFRRFWTKKMKRKKINLYTTWAYFDTTHFLME